MDEFINMIAIEQMLFLENLEENYKKNSYDIDWIQ